MRLLPLLSWALVLALSGTAFAQDWNEFSSREDRFTITFPGQPEISETTWVLSTAPSCRRGFTAASRGRGATP